MAQEGQGVPSALTGLMIVPQARAWADGQRTFTPELDAAVGLRLAYPIGAKVRDIIRKKGIEAFEIP